MNTNEGKNKNKNHVREMIINELLQKVLIKPSKLHFQIMQRNSSVPFHNFLQEETKINKINK